MGWIFETVLNPSKMSVCVCDVSVGVQKEEEGEEGELAKSNHIF
jgi:hypothetical protein